MRRTLICAAAAVLASGCGVKGPPDLAGDRDDAFPRTNPAGAVPPEVVPRSLFERTTHYDSFGRPIE
jgi:hypothetical protein